MIQGKHLCVAGTVLLLCLPILAEAGAPQRISYQGRLTDAGGIPVPDNPGQSITFKIYDIAVGGVALWTETQSLAVTNGLFSAELGAVTPLTNSIFADTNRWLGVTAFAAELTPRSRLVSAPYSYRVGTVDAAAGGVIQGGVAVLGPISSGSPSLEGLIESYMNGAANPIVTIGYDASGPGGKIWLWDENHLVNGRIEADGNGTGGYLEITSGAVGRMFTVDGNNAGTQEPRVSLTGASQFVNLAMDQTGDASVQLPVDAVSSTELLDEPGVVSAAEGLTSVKLTAIGYYPLLSTTITLPNAGYVLVMGTCQPIINHWNLTTSAANFGVSTSSTSLPSNQDIGISLPPSAPTGDYNWPVTAQTVLSMTAGAHTLYFLARKTSTATDTIDVYDMQLTVLYLPTTYGIVDAPVPPTPESELDIASAVLLTPPDPELERRKSIDANSLRMAQEIAEMKIELETLKQQIKQNGEQ